MFFVISGFLITSLLLKERAQSGTINIKSFYIRRAFRIWPAFYALFAVVATLGLTHTISLHAGEAIAAGLYLWDYYPAGATWYLSHTWSLAIEEQFYFLWPLTLKLARNIGGVRIAIGVIALSPCIRVINYLVFPGLRGHIPVMLHTRADALMFGAALAILYCHADCQVFLQACFRLRLHIFASLFLFLISPVLACYLAGKYLLPVGWTLDGVAVVLMLAWTIQNPKSWIGKLLNSRLAVHIGLISYSLYLWQQMFLGHPHSAIFRFPINFVLAFVAAEVSYKFIERPFLRIRARFSECSARQISSAVGALAT